MPALPTALTYGFVDGQFILSVADTITDQDRLPDGVAPPAGSSITLTPKEPIRKVFGVGLSATILGNPTVLTFDQNGFVVDGTFTRMASLVTGVYIVRVNIVGAPMVIQDYEVQVLATHTVLAPCDLGAGVPLGGAVLSPSQYTEIMARIDALGGGGQGGSITDYSTVTALPGYPTSFPPTIGSGAAQAVAGNDARLTDQRVPSNGSVSNAKVASGAAIDLDKTADSATRVAMSAAERTKLGGVSSGATTNATDAALRDRATHTGTQPSTSISDFTEAAQDAIAALLQGASGVTLAYDDAANTLTITGGGAGGTLDAEAVRDAIGVAMVGADPIAITVNDAADTITVSTTATANATNAALRDRTTHTGVQPISSVSGLQALLDNSLKLKSNAAVDLVSSTDKVAGWVVASDGTATATWPNRFEFFYKPPAGVASLTGYFNEYGEIRVVAAKNDTTAFRAFTRNNPSQAAHNTTTPLIELQDDRNTRTSLFGVYADGSVKAVGAVTAPNLNVVLEFAATTPPVGTPAGTVVFRKRS